MNRRNEFMDFPGYVTVCAQCGYHFVKGDEAVRVRQTGDVIHSDCYIDYADDNKEEFCDTLSF